MSSPLGLTIDGDALVLDVHVAQLRGGLIDIPESANPLVLEIGSSDRDTMDVEFLPYHPHAFLATCEPLIDKYARALARNPDKALQRGDAYQDLSRHHPRGLVLPLAIGPAPEGPRVMNVGNNSGCSSLLPLNLRSKRLLWCRNVAQQRRVVSITLGRLLGLLGRPVAFLKLDAQGLDMAIVESAAPPAVLAPDGDDASARPRAPVGALRSLRRFSVEVVADDCDTLYEGQPKCTQVRAMTTLASVMSPIRHGRARAWTLWAPAGAHYWPWPPAVTDGHALAPRATASRH